MKGVYADFYWSVRNTKAGYAWAIKKDWAKDAEVLQRSEDDDDPDSRYFKTAKEAAYEAKITIREIYNP